MTSDDNVYRTIYDEDEKKLKRVLILDEVLQCDPPFLEEYKEQRQLEKENESFIEESSNSISCSLKYIDNLKDVQEQV